MSLAEIKEAVGELSVGELTELASFIRQREDAAWDQQIDADFAEWKDRLQESFVNIEPGRARVTRLPPRN